MHVSTKLGGETADGQMRPGRTRTRCHDMNICCIHGHAEWKNDQLRSVIHQHKLLSQILDLVIFHV